MAIVGNASLWADIFPEGLIPDIIELVVSTWNNAFEKPNPTDHEEPISRRFREALRHTKNGSKDLPVSIWPESTETDPVTGKEIGRIDLRFGHGFDEDVYFAFECKRLRIPRNSGMDVNTSEYVGTGGMMCFVTGKYSKTQHHGGMIGYVMDGDIKKAMTSVKNSVTKKRKELCLIKKSGFGTSSILPNEQLVKETNHLFGGRKFAIHHVFLGV